MFEFVDDRIKHNDAPRFSVKWIKTGEGAYRFLWESAIWIDEEINPAADVLFYARIARLMGEFIHDHEQLQS